MATASVVPGRSERPGRIQHQRQVRLSGKPRADRVRVMGDVPEIYMVEARPRSRPKPSPVSPNPAPRPHEGTLPPLVLNFFSDVPDGTELALGKVPQRDTAAYVRAIHSAGNRSIICNVNCAGGDAEGSLAIATALLQHERRVTCRITGRCSSAAVFIALAADTRTIVPTGSVLLHAAFRLCTPAQRDAIWALPQSAKDAIDDSLNDINDASEALLTARLGVSGEVARRWMKEDRKWSATEALERGFVHAIAAEAHLETA
jgi:ATP-dependent protease ClpP protease subunit